MDIPAPINAAASITLPLDTVLEVLRASRGQLSDETDALMKVEVVSALEAQDELTEEEVQQVMAWAFKENPWGL